MNIAKSKSAAALLFSGLLAATSGQAASISYYLNHSDKLADGPNYLQVTISDGIDGAIDFSVQVLQPLFDIGGSGISIGKFAFNEVPGIDLKKWNVEVTSDPYGKAQTGQPKPMSGFGYYDVRVNVPKPKKYYPPPTTTLEFSIIGISFDEITSYVDLAKYSSLGPSFFSAEVTGIDLCSDGEFATQTVQRRTRPSNHGGGSKCKPTLAYFGGVEQAVPAPPAAWLLGTGVAGLVVRRWRFARRRRFAA